jgi:hypothetical protein
MAAVLRYAFELPFPEVGRLDAEGAQVDVTLAAMVDLIVDGVLNGLDA